MIARGYAHDGEHAFEALRTWTLYVRRNADGRALVYGTHATQWRGERDLSAGERLDPGEDVVGAIRRVAEAIAAPAHLAQECIANLPAEPLD